MRAVPSSTALAFGALSLLGLGWTWIAPPGPPPPPPRSLSARLAALEAGGPRPWYDGGPQARFLEAMGLLARVERELAGLDEPLGDAWSQGVEAARQSRAATLGAWMSRLQAVLIAEPDIIWQKQRQESAAWTRPVLPRRVATRVGVAAGLRLLDPGNRTHGVHEIAWVGGGQVLLLGSGSAWVAAVGEPPQRLALPSGIGGQLGFVGTYASQPMEVAVQAQEDGREALVLLRLDGPGGPRSLGVVPGDGPCGAAGLRLRRTQESGAGARLEIRRTCDGTRFSSELWPLRQGRYRPATPRRQRGFRVVLRG